MSNYQSILRTANYIAGSWHETGTGETLTVVDKFTQQTIAELPMASEAQMEQAIQAAEAGFNVIRSWSAGKRAEHLTRLRDLLAKHQDAFVDLIVAEAGKPLGYSQAEIARCLSTLNIAIEEATRMTGEVVAMDFAGGTGKRAHTNRVPVGPVACISPFNFPLNLALHKIAPALACGCSVVLKPAPQSPLTCLAFAQLIEDAGYPAGVASILVCDIPEAQKMVTDPRFKLLSFTGSPQVGWYLKTIAGEKKVALELGGNASVIVDESADVAKAAKLTATGAYLYAGQICISTQRVYVHEKVYSEFRDKLLVAMEQLKSGDPTSSEVINGPIIDAGHLERISSWVEEAKAAGAEVLAGGEVSNAQGNVYAPTLLTNTTTAMKVVSEEVFGPVAIIEPIADFKEGIKRTNDSKFGLQAGIFTNRIDHMKLAHDELDVGGVIVNNVPGFRIDNMPYGGVKASGLGREGVRYAIDDMTEIRLLVY